MAKKKAGSKAPQATVDTKLLKGRVYCITQRREIYLAETYALSLSRLGAKAVDAPSVEVTHLVTANGTPNKTTQKKLDSLAKKGAVIEVLSEDDFKEHLLLPAELIVDMVRGNEGDHELLRNIIGDYDYTMPSVLVADVDFRGQDCGEGLFQKVVLQDVDLRDATMTNGTLSGSTRVQFDGARFESSHVHRPVDSSFKGAELPGINLTGSCDGCNFEGANMRGGRVRMRAAKTGGEVPPVFRSVNLDASDLSRCAWSNLDFSGSSMVKSEWDNVEVDGASFEGADLSECEMVRVNLSFAKLAGAKFHGARLTEVDLRGADLEGADFTGVVFINTEFTAGLDPSSVKGLAEALSGGPSVGTSFTTLSTAVESASKVKFDLFLLAEAKGKGSSKAEPTLCSISLDCYDNGGRFRVFSAIDTPSGEREMFHTDTFEEAFKRSVLAAAGAQVRFETITVKTSKSPLPGPKLRELFIEAAAEAFDQTPPDPASLKALTKTFRAKLKAETDKKKAQEKKNAAKWAKSVAEGHAKAAAAEKAVRPQPEDKVTDFATFVAALELRADAGRVKNAKKMLKGSGFQLFHDASKPGQVRGVIKSQTDEELVYACKLDSEGQFTCCTQNLRPCGGLRGALCKHQLVLLMGLVQAGELDPKNTDTWVEQSLDHEPELDKDEMSEILLRYQGAAAGKIDWRPTETVPEDFYSF